MTSENNLDSIIDEITFVENKHIIFFKSRPSISNDNSYLKLKDCIIFNPYSIPTKEKRIPGLLYRNYQLGDKIILPNDIIKDLMSEIDKKLSSN